MATRTTTTSSFLLGNQEFLLRGDKRIICFFCLKDITPTTVKIEEGTTTKTNTPRAQQDGRKHCYLFPLRNISRFLKFDGVERSISDKGIVETCGDCVSFTEEFTELYKSLDVIQLRMNWCLRRIDEVMRISEKKQLDDNDDGKEKFRKSHFAALRKKTIVNGLKKIRQTSLPFVSVKRIRLTGQKRKSSSTDIRTTTTTTGGPQDRIQIQNASYSVEENWIKEVPSCNRVHPMNLTGRERMTIMIMHGKLMGESRQDLRHDNQNESSLPTDKVDNLEVKEEPCYTKEEEEEEEEMEHDFNSLTFIHEDNPEQLEQFASEKMLSPSNECSPADASISSFEEATTTSQKRDHLSCPFCRATFITKENTVSVHPMRLNLHILQYHCENYYFPNQKLDSVTPFQYQKILYDLLLQDYCIEKDSRYHCPFCAVRFLSITGNHKWEYLGRFKHHLLNEHREEIEAKLLEIQQHPRLPEKLINCNPEGMRCECGVYLVSLSAHASHRRFHCTLEIAGNSTTTSKRTAPGTRTDLLTEDCFPESKWQGKASSSNSISRDLDMNRDSLPCPFCKAVFVATERTKTIQEMRYNGHILQNHGKHVFPSQKLDMITDSQYKKIISNLLFRDYCIEKMNKLYCPFCTRSFDSKKGRHKSDCIIYFKLHLLNKHRAELEDKLMEIQRSPLLHEELKAGNPEGISGVSYLKSLQQYQSAVEASSSQPYSHSTTSNAKGDEFSKKSSPPTSNAELDSPSENQCNNPQMSEEERESCDSKGIVCECGVCLPNRSCHQLHRLYYCTRRSTTRTVEGLQNTIGLQNEAELPPSTSSSDLAGPSSSSSAKIRRTKWSEYEGNTLTPNACPYCIEKGLVYCDKKALRHHLMRHHMDHFFSNVRNGNLVSVEQFKMIANKLLFADIIGVTQQHHDTCVLCRRKIKPGRTGHMRIIRIKEHFVGQHYEYLKDKLCSFQEDPNLPARLSKWQVSG